MWQRILVLLAGPAFNFLFAIVAYWFMFSTGVPGIKPLIGSVTADSVAARAGIEPNDEIETIGGRPTETWEAATLAIFEELLDDARIDLSVRSADGKIKNVSLDVRGREAELTEPSALFKGLGIRPGPAVPAVIGGVAADSAAERAGLKVNDEVLRADGNAIDTWDAWVEFIRTRPGETVSVEIRRARRSDHAAARDRIRRGRRQDDRTDRRRELERDTGAGARGDARRAALRRARVAAAWCRKDVGDDVAHREDARAHGGRSRFR